MHPLGVRTSVAQDADTHCNLLSASCQRRFTAFPSPVERREAPARESLLLRFMFPARRSGRRLAGENRGWGFELGGGGLGWGYAVRA